jgi:Tfp pilus assembly protein PilV
MVMRQATNSKERARGIALIEALIAMVVLAVGILSIAKLNTVMMGVSGQAKARAEAIMLADAKVAELRNSIIKTQYSGLVSSAAAETLAGVSANFSRTWTVADDTSPDRKRIEVSVSWTDNANVAQVVEVNSVVAWNDPAKALGFWNSDSAAAGSYARPPTGSAALGTGTTTDSDGTDQSGGLKIRVADGKRILYDTNAGNKILLTVDEAEAFSTIEGYVYLDTDHAPTPGNVYVLISDAAYCSRTIASPVAYYPDDTTNKYQRFAYRCYVGGGWYGNVGIVRIDNANTNDKVCLGDPAVTTSYSTDSASKIPVQSTNRMYRGYKLITGAIYSSTGIGIASGGSYTAVSYTGHNFLLTRLAGAETCTSNLSKVSTADPFQGNPGKFVCLNYPEASPDGCPDPLPNSGTTVVSLVVSGTVLLEPEGSLPVVTGIAIDSGTCSVGALVPATKSYSYTCSINLVGWTGATWSANMTVSHNGYMCATGASGPATVTAESDTIAFSGQSVAGTAVTQDFTLGQTSDDCPL